MSEPLLTSSGRESRRVLLDRFVAIATGNCWLRGQPSSKRRHSGLRCISGKCLNCAHSPSDVFFDHRFVGLATRKPSITITSLVVASGSNLTLGMVLEDEYSRYSHLQYVNSANCSPCDVIKKMADFQEDGDRKLQMFAYLHVGATTLSITIGLYSWYCFIYRNKKFACQWHLKELCLHTDLLLVFDIKSSTFD